MTDDAITGEVVDLHPRRSGVRSERNSTGRRRQPLKGDRRELFIKAYLANGYNAVQAAIDSGSRPSRAVAEASGYLSDPNIQAMRAAAMHRAVEIGLLTAERWVDEVRAVAYSSLGDALGPDGKLLPLEQCPPSFLRAVASAEIDKAGRLVKVRLWPKMDALTDIAKHLGLFERDNHQKIADVAVTVRLVG